MLLYVSKDIEDTVRFMKYARTKFFRYHALQGLGGCSLASKETWRFTPDQNFSSQSDIDWNQSISDIDKQLYKKYNLSEAEIAYIEKTIKPME